VTITAWEGLERGGILAADHVLIHGGVGGVGHVAVQLAKAAGGGGGNTTGSPDGAAARPPPWGGGNKKIHDGTVTADGDRLTAGRGFDLIFDTVGGDNLRASFEAAADEGRIATTNAIITQDLSPLHAKALSFYVIFMLLPLLHGGLGRDRYARILRSAAAL